MDTKLRFLLKSVNPSRGEYLAKRLYLASRYLWIDELYKRLLQETAMLVCGLSPAASVPLPFPQPTELCAADLQAKGLQMEAAKVANFWHTPDKEELSSALADKMEPGVLPVQRYVLIMAVRETIAMAVATVPVTEEEQKKQKKLHRKGTAFVRDSELARKHYQHACELLKLLPPLLQ